LQDRRTDAEKGLEVNNWLKFPTSFSPDNSGLLMKALCETQVNRLVWTLWGGGAEKLFQPAQPAIINVFRANRICHQMTRSGINNELRPDAIITKCIIELV